MIKGTALVLSLALAGCALGPRRLRADCTWSHRQDTPLERHVQNGAAVAMVGGFLTYVAAFFAKRPDVALPALGAAMAALPVAWWSQGAFEEVPVGRNWRCRP